MTQLEHSLTDWLVLAVDDERDNLELVVETLEYHDMQAVTAANGKQALDVLEKQTIHLVLMDLSMPVMDGWQALRRIKDNERTKAIPVIALSAHAIVGDERRALDAGFDGYITKPINVRSFMDEIRQILSKCATIISNNEQS